MHIKIEITENDLKNLIKRELEQKLNIIVDIKEVSIFVKSKQNYRSEWEKSDFKAIYERF